MGSGFTTFTAGNVLTASEVNNYLMEQSVMVFATTGARDSAITAPEDGMVCYVTGDDSLYQYETISAVSAWRKLAAQVPHTTHGARAAIGAATVATTTPAAFGTSYTLSFTKLRADTLLHFDVRASFIIATAANSSLTLTIGDGTNTYTVLTEAMNGIATLRHHCYIGRGVSTAIAAGTSTWTVKAATSVAANLTYDANDYCQVTIMESL